jgi:hypothetical protein
MARMKEHSMIETLRGRVATLPGATLELLLAAGSLASFGWLLTHDHIHPLVVYLLQLYLTF